MVGHSRSIGRVPAEVVEWRVQLERCLNTVVYRSAHRTFGSSAYVRNVPFSSYSRVIAPGVGHDSWDRPPRQGHCYSAIVSPEPPASTGKSFNFGNPSRMGRTVSA